MILWSMAGPGSFDATQAESSRGVPLPPVGVSTSMRSSGDVKLRCLHPLKIVNCLEMEIVEFLSSFWTMQIGELAALVPTNARYQQIWLASMPSKVRD